MFMWSVGPLEGECLRGLPGLSTLHLGTWPDEELWSKTRGKTAKLGSQWRIGFSIVWFSIV